MLSEWMQRNLAVQGYCLTERESARLGIGLRFSTGLCIPLFATGLVLGSAPLVFALAGIAAVAGFTSRHPFDLLWNHGVRRLIDAPDLPPNPPRRRHAFKIGMVWLTLVAALIAVGSETAAVALGTPMLVACGLVTSFNFCVPSTILNRLERRYRPARAGA